MLEFTPDAPLLVFGGPYSNLQATEALIAEAQRLGLPPDRVICTGDVVAYCADPEATSRRIACWGCHVIQGNCEQQLAEGAPDCACNFEDGSACAALAKGWYPFALSEVSQDMRSWMGALPETLRFKFAGMSFRVVHGGVSLVNRWVFASDSVALAAECQAAASDIVIAGHAGLPFIAQSGLAKSGLSKSGLQTWFNPGVIGMPANDGTTDVWYGLITPNAGRATGGVTLSTHRLAYDHRSASATMRRHGYANGYARALVTGLWPSLDILPAAERSMAGKRLRSRTLALKPKPALQSSGTQPTISA